MNLVFVQNTGVFANGTATHPDGVTAGKLAVFNAATGAEHSFEDAAAPSSFYIVRGDDTQPRISPIIKSADIVNADYSAYVAPAKKLVSITSIPAGPTGGDTYTVKVVNLKTDTEPFVRKNYEIVVPASQNDEDSIYALVAANKADGSADKFVDFGANKIDTKTVTGTNGNLILTVTDGETGLSISYTTAFNTNVATTIDDIVTNHAASLLANFGITVTDGTTTAIFTGGVDSGDFTIVDTGSTGDMAASISVTEATTLLIQSDELEDNFQVFLNDLTGSGISGATVTVTTAWAQGSGSAAQIAALETIGLGGLSNLYRETPQPLIPDTFADTATPLNYNVWNFLVKTNQEGQSPVKGNQYYQVTVAGATAVTGSWNTFLGL
jgi:hypothetical protein